MSSTKRTEAPGFPPIVLVVGAQATLRQAAIAELRDRVIGDGPRDFNEDRFDLANAGDAKRVIGAARTLPVLAPARLSITSDHELWGWGPLPWTAFLMAYPDEFNLVIEE